MTLGEMLKMKLNRGNEVPVPASPVALTGPVLNIKPANTPALLAKATAGLDLTKYRLFVQVSYRENYGAHDWSGEGVCPQHWKVKGGEDILIAQYDTVPTYEAVQADYDAAKKDQEWSNESSEQHLNGWYVCAPNALSYSEEQDATFGD